MRISMKVILLLNLYFISFSFKATKSLVEQLIYTQGNQGFT